MHNFAFAKKNNIRLKPLRAKRFISAQKIWQTWVPYLTLLVGIVLGSMLEQTTRLSGHAYIPYFINQVINTYTLKFVDVAAFAFISSFSLHVLMLFFSFSCIGVPALIALPFLKGIYIGCISGYLYSSMGLTGIIVNILIFLLPQVAEALLICVLCTHALYVSSGLFNLLITKKYDSFIRMQLFTQVFLYSSLALIPTCLLSATLSYIFPFTLF